MLFPALFFYLFAGVCISAAIMVIAARNPVHSVLFLILAFVNAAALFILLGAEFLAMILIIVYVGAVLVLFLFVVMMLDVDFAELRQGFLQYLPIGAFLGAILLIELVLVLVGWTIDPNAQQTVAAYWQQTLGILPTTDFSYGGRIQHFSLTARDRLDPTAPNYFGDAQAMPLDTGETQHALPRRIQLLNGAGKICNSE